jgi:iron complex transport system substrate-binding protein
VNGERKGKSMKETIEMPGMLLPEVDDATRREFLIGAAGLLLLPVACGGEGNEDGGTNSDETRLIRHYLGETRVPVNPQRIVAADTGLTLGALVSVDAIPLAAGSLASFMGRDFNEALYPMVDDVEPISVESGINVEQIAALEPDMIVGIGPGLVEEVYDQLSEIAPTVPVDLPPGSSVREYMRKVAETVGKTELLEERLAALDAKLASLREELPEIGTVSIVSVFDASEVFVYNEPYELAQFVSALGGEVVPKFSELGAEPGEDGDLNPRVPISLERLPEVDGETLFLSQVTANEEEAGSLEQVQGNPLWQRLPAVENGRVETFNRITIGGIGGIPGWEQTIEQVAEFFRKEG